MTTQQDNNNLPVQQAVVKSKLGRPRKIHIDPDQPKWICYKCGVKHGSFKCGIATWHTDICGCCGKMQACTEPRDFGYLLLGWKQREDELLGKYHDEDESS
jgi:hypothetical protein